MLTLYIYDIMLTLSTIKGSVMEMISIRVSKKVKQEFRLNCMKNNRSMQYVIDKFITQFNAKHAMKEKEKKKKEVQQ